MTQPEETDVRRQVRESCLSGSLLAELSAVRWRYGTDEFQQAIDAAAEIHNSRECNLLDAFEASELASHSGGDFFALQHFFVKLLPELHAEVEQVIRCVTALRERAGNDMMANEPNRAFRAWCEKDLGRVETTLDLIRCNPETEFGVLCFVLEAGACFDVDRFVREAIELIASQDSQSFVLAGSTALGRISYEENIPARGKAASALVEIARTSDVDIELANAVGALLSIYSQDPPALEELLSQVIEHAKSKFEEGSRYVIAQALSHHRKVVSPALFSLLLTVLESVKSDEVGAIDHIDHAFYDVFEKSLWNRIADFLVVLFRNTEGKVGFRNLDSFAHKLMSERSDFRDWILVRWLTTGDRESCNEIATLLIEVAVRGGNPVQVDFLENDLSDGDLSLVCRRALGYLPLSPVACCSILISAARASEAVRTEIQDLLFDPLLLNYPGSAREYLEGVAADSSDAAQGVTKGALAALERHHEALNCIGDIAELHPSTKARAAYADRQHEFFESAHREARENSQLLSMVTQINLLYGSVSASYYDRTRAGAPERHEMGMSTHSTSVEYPSLDALDPVGLAYSGFLFRLGRRRQ